MGGVSPGKCVGGATGGHGAARQCHKHNERAGGGGKAPPRPHEGRRPGIELSSEGRGPQRSPVLRTGFRASRVPFEDGWLSRKQGALSRKGGFRGSKLQRQRSVRCIAMHTSNPREYPLVTLDGARRDGALSAAGLLARVAGVVVEERRTPKSPKADGSNGRRQGAAKREDNIESVREPGMPRQYK
jgi:hypothetical protein